MGFFNDVGNTFGHIGQTIASPVVKVFTDPRKLNLGDALVLGSAGILSPAVNANRNRADIVPTLAIAGAFYGGAAAASYAWGGPVVAPAGTLTTSPSFGVTSGLGYGPLDLGAGTHYGVTTLSPTGLGAPVATFGQGGSIASASYAPATIGITAPTGTAGAGSSSSGFTLTGLGTRTEAAVAKVWKGLTTVAGAQQVLQLLGLGGKPGDPGSGGGGIQSLAQQIPGWLGGGSTGGGGTTSTTVNQAKPSIPTFVYVIALALVAWFLAKRYKLA